jgi:hypothetical protein
MHFRTSFEQQFRLLHLLNTYRYISRSIIPNITGNNYYLFVSGEKSNVS